MILYTIIPLEYIFAEDDDEDKKEKIISANDFEIKQGTVSLMASPLNGGQMKVNRIISTNALDYLNPDWQPGSIISIL